jgi:hypothetical protein
VALSVPDVPRVPRPTPGARLQVAGTLR